VQGISTTSDMSRDEMAKGIIGAGVAAGAGTPQITRFGT
jgi:hypothetical protein